MIYHTPGALTIKLTKRYNGEKVLRRCADLAKMGRPKVENPRDKRVMIRFTEEEYHKLEKYAAEKNFTITEAVRNGVCKMLDSKK